jgi:hypothetical protein
LACRKRQQQTQKVEMEKRKGDDVTLAMSAKPNNSSFSIIFIVMKIDAQMWNLFCLFLTETKIYH